MSDQTSLEIAAREVFERKAEALQRETSSLDLQPATWVLSQLLTDTKGQVPANLRSEVRIRLVETIFMDEAGDVVIDSHHQLRLDLQVELVASVVEEVHERPNQESVPILNTSARVTRNGHRETLGHESAEWASIDSVTN